MLMIQLKRFEMGFGFTSMFSSSKIQKKVSYPKVLNINKFISKEVSGSDYVYDLASVVVHQGHSSKSGHYYSYVKGSNKMWYKMDDQHISRAKEQVALGQQAYVLFYTLRGTDPNRKGTPQLEPVPQAPKVKTKLKIVNRNAPKNHNGINPESMVQNDTGYWKRAKEKKALLDSYAQNNALEQASYVRKRKRDDYDMGLDKGHVPKKRRKLNNGGIARDNKFQKYKGRNKNKKNGKRRNYFKGSKKNFKA